MKELTESQKYILNTIIIQTNISGRIQSADSIATLLNSTKANIYQHTKAIEKKGFIRTKKHTYGLYPVMTPECKKITLKLVIEDE